MSKGGKSTGLDKTGFAEAVKKRLADRGWQRSVTYKPDDFSLSLGDNSPTLFLSSSYTDWMAAGSDEARFQVVDKLVAIALDTSDRENRTFAQVSADILPAVRSRAYYQNLWMTMDDTKPADFAGTYRSLADWLCTILTINTATSIGTIGKKELEDWGMSFDDVMTVAMKNLSTFKTPQFEKHKDGFHYLNGDDYYDPSMLLMPETFKALPLKGSPVAVAVTRTLVVVAGSDDFAALNAMAETVEAEFAKDPRAISYIPLILRENEWHVFEGGRESSPALDRLRRLQYLADYGGQLSLLEAYNKKTGRDVYVGQLDAIEDDGRLVTWSSLVSGIVTLLPMSDVVIVAPADLKNPFARHFSDVMTVAGNVAIEPDVWPPLYIFENGLGHDLANKLYDAYPQPKEFPDIGKKS